MSEVDEPSDPSTWADRLYKAMAERQAAYGTGGDLLLKRNAARDMLGLVISFLMELPGFNKESVHLPLKDLMIFLSDLDRGRDHPWSAPVNFGGTNITNTAQGELKMWVRAAFEVLRENGFKAVEAYRHIAKGLDNSGRSGRKGLPVRWQLVQQWCRESETQSDHQIRETLQYWWADFRAATAGIHVVDDWGRPVTEKQIAGRFADLCWSLPQLRDRSFSGGSE